MNQGRLLVFFGPPLFYATADAHPMSPLAFPNHLNDPLERDVSHLSTAEELRRMLSAGPEVIVTRKNYEVPVARDIRWLVETYIAENCRPTWQGDLSEPRLGLRPHVIYACR